MNLSAFCIHRPAFTIVLSLIMSIIGVICFLQLPVRWIPNITSPVVYISTSYPGANAKLVERDITKPIEDRLSGINGIESLNSVSSQNNSEIILDFKLGTKLATVLEDVRSNVERVRGSLPKDAENPIVSKASANSNKILYVSFLDNNRSQRELSDYIDKYIAPSFETIDGVGSVRMHGKQISAMQIKLDPAKMAGANVTVEDVTQTLREQNASIPSGQLHGLDKYYSIVANTGLKTADEFNNLIIRNTNNQTVRLRDIGVAKLAADDIDSSFRINGKSGIALGIAAQSTANPLDVEKNIQKLFANINRTLPAGMQAKIMHNQADHIRASIWSVYESFAEAVLFVWLVILIFLGSFRATLIPIVTIPVCVISTFAILYAFGFSINTITLMAFVLAIGLVVDDAIVMLENISRHIEAGMNVMQASLIGSREILVPIIAMTLTLAAVYTPIAFTPGLLGVLFQEFTFTLAGAVIISGIVAITLSPMMCARILKPVKQTSRYNSFQLHLLQQLQSQYQSALQKILHKRKFIVGGLLLVILSGGVVYHYLQSELAPAEEMNTVIAMISSPNNSSFKYTENYVKKMEAIIAKETDVTSYLTISGMGASNMGYFILNLKPKKERHLSTQEIMAHLSQEASKLSGVRTNVFTPPPPLTRFATRDEGDTLGIVLKTSTDYFHLQQASKQIVEELKQNPMFLHVGNSLNWNTEQFQVTIDRDRAADLKVSIPTITNTISTLIAGRNVGKTDDVNVLLKIEDVFLSDPNIFQHLYVRNSEDKMLPLASMLTVKETTTPEVFNHTDRLRADTISVQLAPKIKISQGIQVLEQVAKQIISDDMKYEFTGEAKNFLDSNGKTIFTFGLALLFIYLVLVAQFESFIDPLIIMLTVPFAIVGALLTLKLFGGTLNIYSNIGLITLIGLIAKHGILITDFANKLREQGKSIHAAVIAAASLRLRPILMTTSAMVLGALPLVLAFGPGAESRQQIGLVITGGLLFGTFFSLIVVPVTYTFLAPFRKIKLNYQEQS